MKRTKESGVTLVYTALALGVLMGFAGLAIDMGVLRYEKRLQQSAADAAAIAGASNLPYDSAAGVGPAAMEAAKTNGFEDNSSLDQNGNPPESCPVAGSVGCVTVTVNNPPLSGPHLNNGKYVEVLVSAVHSTYFMKIFGVNSEVVIARAVATSVSGGTDSGCLYTLDPNTVGIQGININGNASLNAVNCGIVDNGNFDTSGNSFQVTAATFGVAGVSTSTKGSLTCTADPSNCPATGMPAASDPLSYLTPPPKPGTYYGDVSTYGSQTLQPGEYSSITFGKNSTVTLNPGIYYIDGTGGISFGGNATVTGSGVMFYFTCPTASPCSGGPTIDARGGGNNTPDLQLSPPTSGPYEGILFYQDPKDTTGPSLGGDDTSFFKGVLYFPKARLTFFGNNTTFSAGMVVAGAVALSGNPTVTVLGTAGLPPGMSIVKSAVLVE